MSFLAFFNAICELKQTDEIYTSNHLTNLIKRNITYGIV